MHYARKAIIFSQIFFRKVKQNRVWKLIFLKEIKTKHLNLLDFFPGTIKN